MPPLSAAGLCEPAAMLICSGLDEAGYGPLLGPLVIVRTTTRCPNLAHFAKAATQAGLALQDSKKLYQGGRLDRLETVALAGMHWLSGQLPRTAAECFNLLGEAPEHRCDIPWMQGAEQLKLPLKAASIPTWQPDNCQAVGLAGALVHPAELNAAMRAGDNKAVVEAQHVARLLADIPDDAEAETVVDRLGGRRYYQQLLGSIVHHERIAILDEIRGCSSYRIDGTHPHRISFQVKGDQLSALCSLASCIAKYARELHMHLLNSYWSSKLRWLQPTAGYPQDAKRWIHQLGSGYTNAWADQLVRGTIPNMAPA